MLTPLRLLCLHFTLGFTTFGCAVGGTSDGPDGLDLDGKADDAADDDACIARGGLYDDVELTRREAELILDMANKADLEVLDHAMGLDADAAQNILDARAETGEICHLADLAAVPEVGTANLARARQFSAVWELAEAGDATIEQLMQDGGTHDGTALTAGEAFIALEMASYASASQLDAIPFFRSDVARNVVRQRRARGGFSSLTEVAEVVGVGSRHVEYLLGGMADWRVFARAAYRHCGSLDPSDTLPATLATACPGLAIEGETLSGDLEGIAFTQEEAALALDFVNGADLRALDVVLDSRAADAIVTARDQSALCDLSRLGNTPYVGPTGLRQLRRFTATWEAVKRGEGTLAQLTALANREVDGIEPLSLHELSLVVDMANRATEEQLDAIPGFRSDAARNVASAQRRGFRSLADLAAVAGVGPAHINYVAESVHAWRAFVREAEGRPACAAFGPDPANVTPSAPTESILTTREAEKVREALDEICADTFCAGDFDYGVDDVGCPGDGRCIVTMHAREHGSSFPATVLDGRSAASLTSRGNGEAGPFTASIEDAYTDADGTWLSVSCDLSGGYFTREDAMNVERGRYSEQLYEGVIDCVRGLETMMRAL